MLAKKTLAAALQENKEVVGGLIPEVTTERNGLMRYDTFKSMKFIVPKTTSDSAGNVAKFTLGGKFVALISCTKNHGGGGAIIAITEMEFATKRVSAQYVCNSMTDVELYKDGEYNFYITGLNNYSEVSGLALCGDIESISAVQSLPEGVSKVNIT